MEILSNIASLVNRIAMDCGGKIKAIHVDNITYNYIINSMSKLLRYSKELELEYEDTITTKCIVLHERGGPIRIWTDRNLDV